ncbi:Uma2 family endonuclease [Nonomuraea basaltis]|uniref:Uma2 family endonuclease n=1 Tax=Nonomuraea basaltis TaxID=2495887 RepID=UPI001F0FDAAD|nr:Uma2 family endonuclease [Nonomuraea basaltis]
MATIEPTPRGIVLPGDPPLTVDRLLEFPCDGKHYELFDGSLLVSPAPTRLHQRIIYRLQRILDDAMPPELEPLSTVNLLVTDKDYYIPDLVVVPEESTESEGLMFSPRDVLLAAEIVSPSTKMRDAGLKTHAYAKAGIPIYWRIEPDEGPTLYVYELDGDRYGPPTAYKGGTVANPTAPFPISFDPADLLIRGKS